MGRIRWLWACVARFVCAAVGLLVLGGCVDEPAPTQLPELTADDLGAYQAFARSKEMAVQLRSVEEELIRRCMVAKGNRWWVPYAQPDYVYQPYKPLSVAEASEYGYSTRTMTPEGRRSDAEQQRFEDSLTEAEREKQYVDIAGGRSADMETLIIGVMEVKYPKEGCRYWAQQELYGDVKAMNEAWYAVMPIAGPPAEAAATSSEQRAAAKVWSRCMAALNRNYADPLDALGEGMEASRRYFTDEEGVEQNSYEGPTAKEIEIAVADAKCRAETGYDVTMEAVTKKAFAQAAVAHEAEILRLLEIYTEAQARARELLG